MLLLALAILNSYGSYAQLPGWASGQVLFSTYYEPVPVKCLTDPNGDLIVYGVGGGITFGNLPPVSGMYVAKMKASTRQWQWAVQSGADHTGDVKATVDSNGNVVLSGAFRGSATFGSLPVLPGTPGNSYNVNSYLATVSGSSGQWLWARKTPNFSVGALAADAGGGVILSGPLYGDAVFGTMPVVRTSSGAAYVGRMTTTTGEWQWIKQLTPTGASSSTQLFPQVATLSSSGELIMAGLFSGTYPFGSSSTLTSKPGVFEFYVASLDTNTGQWRWATQSQSDGQFYNTPIAMALSGNNILISSSARANTSFGSSLTTGNTSGCYLGRLNRTSGAWQWFSPIPGANISSITPTAAGYVVVGTFADRLSFNASNVLTSVGATDIFVAGLNNADQWQWATRGGGVNEEECRAGTVLGTGEIMITGVFSSEDRTELGPQLSLTIPYAYNSPHKFFLASLNSTSFLLNDISPYLNAHGIVPTSAVVATFNQSIAPATATNLRVSSGLRQGRRTGALVLASSGNATNNVVTFQPTLPFLPNELVTVAIPRTVQSVTQQDMTPFVYQFRTAVGGPGRGFLTGTDSLSGSRNSDFARCADMDNDGDLDVVTSGAAGSSIQVSFNDGTGHFPRIAITTAPTTGTVAGLALEDVDGDGDMDVIYTALHAAAPDSAVVQFNAGSGTFRGRAAVAAGENPRGICLGDLDADGDADLVVANANASGTLSIRQNDGTGRFTGTTTLTTGSTTRSVATGDLDNDGDLDIVGANQGSATVSVAYNNGAGSFGTPVSVATGPAPHTVVLGDVNADNILDIVTAGQGGSKAITLLLTPYRLNYTTTHYAAPDASAIELADLDADQDLDILVLDKANRVVRPLVCFRPGDFGGAPTVRVNLLPETLLVGDLDGDSDIDMLSANRNGSFSPRFNTGLVTAVVSGAKAVAAASVYPVPAHGQLTVQLEPRTGPVSLILFNTLGQQVLSVPNQLPAADGTLQMPLSTLSPGIYLLRISSQKATSTQHILVE